MTVQKKKPAKKAKADKNITPVVQQMLKAASAIYLTDELSPGITVSYIRKDDVFYASLCRYPDTNTRVMMYNAQAPTLPEAVADLVVKFREGAKEALVFFREKLESANQSAAFNRRKVAK